MIYRDTSNRLNKYDNLKGLAIILVVFSHFIGFANENPLYFLHNFIHMIHLPIFFFVAGYFSKISKDLPIKSFKRLLIPFIVFCILYALYNQFILGESTKLLFVYPGMGLWFLISLFTMKMMLPIMDKLRYPVLTAFILSVFTGFLSISEFGLSRTFAYMPIFLIGFYYNSYADNFCKKHQKIYSFLSKKHMLALLSILVFGVLIAIAYVVPFKIIVLKYAISFSLNDLIMRTIVISAGILYTLIIHKLMTNSSGFITKIGRNSMSVYIFHLFLVVPFRNFFSSVYFTNPVLCVILILISTLVVAYVFSRDIVSRGLNACMDGIYKIIMFS